MAAPVDAESRDGLELEAMRTLDSSWLPCTVSLRSFGRGLVVHFGSQEPEDTILTESEMLKRLRFRSIPLQGDDCSHIEQGKHVLAACRSQFPDCFHDAEVEKVLRVRHSKRINCRCTFTVKLLRKDVTGETFIVSSGSIMRLAEKSIKDHSVVSEFLKSVEGQSIYSASPFVPVNQGNGVEEDLDRLLEKQKGGNMFDDPKDGISRDILFGIGMKVEKKGQAQRRLIDEFDASSLPVQDPEEQIRLEASAQDPMKVQLDVEVEVPLPFGSSIFELSNNKSRLSPLAARAALASIVSAAHSVVTDGTKAGDSRIIDSMSPLSDKSLEVPSPSIPVASESIDYRATETCSTNETKVREPTKIARVTRSKAQGGSAAANCENQITSCDEDIQKSSLANARRFTRSSGIAERENVTVKQGLANDLTHMTTSNRNSTKRKVSQKNERFSSPIDAEFHGPSKEKFEKTVDNKKKVEEKTSDAKQKDAEETSDAIKNVQQNKGSRENSHGQKRKLASSRKQERRFSPRLQFLPRTRSQGKSQL